MDGGSNAHTQFPQLSVLAKSLDWSGYQECREISSQPPPQRRRYLDLLPPRVPLFHKNEKRDAAKRSKFLNRIRFAAIHLLEVYCEEPRQDSETFSFFPHPNHGLKDLADKVYRVLRSNWRCSCSQSAATSSRVKEARLSLVRHRTFATKSVQCPIKFEVLLPICKREITWKITNVEVKSAVYVSSRALYPESLLTIRIDQRRMPLPHTKEKLSKRTYVTSFAEAMKHYVSICSSKTGYFGISTLSLWNKTKRITKPCNPCISS